MNPATAQARMFSPTDIFWVLGAIVCCVAGIAPIAKFFHGAELILFATGIAVCVAGAMLWLRLRHLNACRKLNVWWLALPCCVFVLLFTALFPLANRHILGAGSDRADALRISASALLHGRYPYTAETYLGNPITPLPGAVLLAIPFLLLGNVSLQNIIWLALFILFSDWVFRSRSTAILYVLLLLGASAANLDDFVVGGDYVVNAMYVCVAVPLVMAAHRPNRSIWAQSLAEVFLGIAIDSRPIYIVVLPLLAAFVLQRRGRDAAVRLLLVAGAVAALLSVPFYLYDPAQFAPLHLRDKLDFIPAKYHAAWVLPVLSLLVSCAGFMVRLTRNRVFLMAGLSLLVMLGPPAIVGWCLDPFTLWGWFQLSLTSVPALFLSVWIFARYEKAGLALRSVREQTAEGTAAFS